MANRSCTLLLKEKIFNKFKTHKSKYSDFISNSEYFNLLVAMAMSDKEFFNKFKKKLDERYEDL